MSDVYINKRVETSNFVVKNVTGSFSSRVASLEQLFQSLRATSHLCFLFEMSISGQDGIVKRILGLMWLTLILTRL